VKSLYSEQITFLTPEQSNYSDTDLEIYKQKTLSFCHQWYSGQTTFQIQTSGSTGKPKPINITRNQMIASAKMTQQAIDLKKGYAALVCLNTEFIAGKMMLVRALEIGMSMYIIYPVANPIKDFSSEIHIDFTAMVPYQLQTILEETPEKIEILNNMKGLIIGGAPVSEHLEKQIQKIQSPVYSTYGMTETVSHIALRKLNGPDASPIYTILPEVKTFTDSRNCLNIYGAVTNHINIATNDVVEMLNERQFIWKGRVDNVINSGGIKIQIEELETKLSAIFQKMNLTNRFIISGKADNSLSSKVVLIIEGEITQSAKTQLQDLLKTNLTKYEIPKQILFIKQFIETESGKIDRIKNINLLLE